MNFIINTFNQCVNSLKVGTLAVAASLTLSAAPVQTLDVGIDTTPSTVLAVKDSIVMVMNGQGHGTGFYVTPTLIVTNSHVVGDNAIVRIQNAANKVFNGVVVTQVQDKDLALIKVEAINAERPLALNTARVSRGDNVYSIGNGGNTWQSVMPGVVEYYYFIANKKMGLYVDMIKTSSDIIPGHSGSPTLNERGEVIGVISLGNGDYGYSVPSGEVLKLLNNLQ